MLAALGKPDCAPGHEGSIVEWFMACLSLGIHQRDVTTMISLCLWELWKHKNKIVFEGASPSMAMMITRIETEGRAWSRAGMFKHDMASFLSVLARWDSASS